MKNFRHQQRPKKSSLVIGRLAVIEALKTGVHLDRIYLDTRAAGKDISEIKGLSLKAGVPVNYVPEARLHAFNITDHQGCVALLSRAHYQSLDDVVSLVIEKGEVPLLVLLDGITDIRNIGGIARTAHCCGVHAIIIPDKGVGALNEDAILTSAGALEKIPVCRVNSLMKAVDQLHLFGIRVYASEMKGSVPVSRVDFTLPSAIVMGSEDRGIFPALMKICDERVNIPMATDFDSLNVSVATGMILYEAMRQRMS